jgi:hypothetical protein
MEAIAGDCREWRSSDLSHDDAEAIIEAVAVLDRNG